MILIGEKLPLTSSSASVTSFGASSVKVIVMLRGFGLRSAISKIAAAESGTEEEGCLTTYEKDCVDAPSVPLTKKHASPASFEVASVAPAESAAPADVACSVKDGGSDCRTTARDELKGCLDDEVDEKLPVWTQSCSATLPGEASRYDMLRAPP